MKKGVDIDKNRMEFLPHFGRESKNGWIRIDMEGVRLEDSSYLFINLDDIEELTRIPLNEITEDIREKWDKERPPILDENSAMNDIEYLDVGKVRLPKSKKSE
jgi:hypothetical protein